VKSHDLLPTAGLCIATSPVLFYSLLTYCLITGTKSIIMDVSKLSILETVFLFTGEHFVISLPLKKMYHAWIQASAALWVLSSSVMLRNVNW